MRAGTQRISRIQGRAKNEMTEAIWRRITVTTWDQACDEVLKPVWDRVRVQIAEAVPGGMRAEW